MDCRPEWYPLRVEHAGAGGTEASPATPGGQSPFAVSLSSAFLILRGLFEEVGILVVPPGRANGSSSKSQGSDPVPVAGDGTQGESARKPSGRKELTVVDTTAIFTESHQHIPSGLMTVLQSVCIPTPKGFKHVSRAEVDEYFGDYFLIHLEPPEFLLLHTYRELDAMRFAWVAVAKYMVEKGHFDRQGRLTPLAKRDMKANCKQLQNPTDDEKGSHTAGAQASSAVASPASTARPQRFVKSMLLDECKRRWAHTPPAKAAVISITSDPVQPRHRPLFQATLELTLTKPRQKFTGQWCRCLLDAENDVCSEALKYLHTIAST